MRMKILLLIILSGVLGANSLAATIVDTGEGSVVGSQYDNLLLRSGAKVAGKFTLTDSYVIESVEGWFDSSRFPSDAVDGDLTIKIYDESSGYPNQVLYSGIVSAPILLQPQWFGLTAISWQLDSGNYWAAFEVEASSSFSAILVQNAQTPLEAYSGFSPYDNQWGPDYGELSFGTRVSGSLVIPVPGALVLFISGGLVIFRLTKGNGNHPFFS